MQLLYTYIFLEKPCISVQLFSKVSNKRTVHSGRVIKRKGDKTVPTDRNEWIFGIFFEILSEW